jgi:hypothetical protein
VQVEFFRRSAVATAASGNGFAQCCSARRRNERKLVLFAFVDRTTSAASEMSSAHNLRRRPATGRMRWRNCVAWSLFVALAWPSLGLLPWVESDFAAADHVAAGHDARPETTHDHGASDIPGSPTHPADHNCFQCQVLKHLARCVVFHLDAPVAAQPPGRAVQPRLGSVPQRTSQIAALPPARGPPLPQA